MKTLTYCAVLIDTVIRSIVDSVINKKVIQLNDLIKCGAGGI